jgi:hypothetical protein
VIKHAEGCDWTPAVCVVLNIAVFEAADAWAEVERCAGKDAVSEVWF